MSNKPKKLVLIDGNAIIHRAYHALPPLTNKKGELLNAVYGFTSILLKVLSDIKPDYIIATFDLRGKTFRHEEYKEYKATRVKAPDELYAQIDRVKEVVRAFNIPIYEKEGFEADDLIGTLADQSENLKLPIENIIVTGDMDTLQLVNHKTIVYALRKGMSDIVIYNEDAVRERYGLEPKQLIDYKGLRGDPSDNIPGVKGIGEKTATELLKEFGSIENIYKNISELKGATKEKLERDKMAGIMSKRLATIIRNVPVKINLDEAVTHDFDRKKLVDLFQELNFFSLIKRIPGSISEAEATQKEETVREVKDFKFEIIQKENAVEFFESLDKQKEVAVSLNVSSGKYFEAGIKGIALSYKTGRAGYVEYAPEVIEVLKKLLENKNVKKIGYNLKFYSEVLQKSGAGLNGELYDIMLAAYVLNPGTKIELENLVLDELGEEMEVGNGKKGQLGLEIESLEEVARKFCHQADYVFKLKNIFEKRIHEISAEQKKELSSLVERILAPAFKKTLEDVFFNLEMPLVPVLVQMEENGVRLNPSVFQDISEKIEKRIETLEKNIYKLAGAEFNINSPKQLAEILFEKLRLPTSDVKKLKTGYSTAAGELTKLRGQHKIIEKVEDYRELFKLKTTYLDTLPTLVDEHSRIHTTFNQAVTATGRLSSSDPNLQNIPIKTELGQLLRTAFEAEPGYKLVSADYSQIDLRVVAHVSGDKKMIEAFQKGEDIHRTTAAEINKVSMSQVTEKMRSRAKALNFGIIYGMSVFGFSERTGVDRDEARKFINDYMEKFSGVAAYMRDTKEFVKKNKYVETELGRRRYIPEIDSPNFQVQNAAERMAINMPIQGMSADIMKLAMIAAEKLIQEYDHESVRTVLQVHDELIFEVKEDLAEEFAKKIKTVMENVYKLKVPLVVDVKIGENWGEI